MRLSALLTLNLWCPEQCPESIQRSKGREGGKMREAGKERGLVLGRSFEICGLQRSLVAMPVGANLEYRSSLTSVPHGVGLKQQAVIL